MLHHKDIKVVVDLSEATKRLADLLGLQWRDVTPQYSTFHKYLLYRPKGWFRTEKVAEFRHFDDGKRIGWSLRLQEHELLGQVESHLSRYMHPDVIEVRLVAEL